MILKVLKISFLALAIAFAGVGKSQGLGLADEKQLEVSLRMIGHQLLLSSGDSSSLVLPLIKEDKSYRIQFENDFALKPTELVRIVDQVIYEAGMASEYVVEVEDCDSMQVVYAFKVNNATNSDIVPCGGRDLPKGCYSILISFNALDMGAIEIPQEEIQQSESREINLSIWFLLGIVALIVAVVVYKRKKKSIPHSKNPNLVSLGKYHFDKLNAELIIEEQRIELTSKEADLLMLLYDTVNTTVEREVLLNKVWGDEGDYIGRTLDVFISKLRKKLEFDTKVKIVNVRGVGYKLVMDVN